MKKKKVYDYVHLLRNEIKIENYSVDEIGRRVYSTFVYGYEGGYLKLCCYGGTAFKIKCEERDAAALILPVMRGNMNEQQVAAYCKNWERWDYYSEYYSIERREAEVNDEPMNEFIRIITFKNDWPLFSLYNKVEVFLGALFWAVVGVALIMFLVYITLNN